MKQYQILFLVIFSLIFTGCQHALSVFSKKDSQYERGLQHTLVRNIVVNGLPKIILNVTFLNQIDKKRWDNDYNNFLVGIYYSNEEKDKLITKNQLTLNDISFEDIKQLTNKDKIYKDIPLKNPWATYYIVKFKKNIDENVLALKYNNIKYGKIYLSFELE